MPNGETRRPMDTAAKIHEEDTCKILNRWKSTTELVFVVLRGVSASGRSELSREPGCEIVFEKF